MPRGAVAVALAVLFGCHPADSTPAETPSEPAYDGPAKRVLVELFSSQGCDSCPDADALIGELPGRGWTRDKLVALTFHVTYWDDLGWQDPYAKPLFDLRQIAYAQQVPAARSDGENTIRGPYTPQMVVDGRVHFSGALEDVAQAEIENARRSPTLVDLEVRASASSDHVAVQVTSRQSEGAEFDTNRSKVGLFAALAQREVQTEVPRGENAGKKLTEHWVVRDFAGPKLFRSAKAVNETEFALSLPGDVESIADTEIVVFAQDLASLRILGVDAISPTATDAPASD